MSEYGFILHTGEVQLDNTIYVHCINDSSLSQWKEAAKNNGIKLTRQKHTFVPEREQNAYDTRDHSNIM